MKILSKLADAAHLTVVVAIIVGFGWTSWRWMRTNTAGVETWIPNWLAAAAALTALALAAWYWNG